MGLDPWPMQSYLYSEMHPNTTCLVTWACWWLCRIGDPPVSLPQFISPSTASLMGRAVLSAAEKEMVYGTRLLGCCWSPSTHSYKRPRQRLLVAYSVSIRLVFLPDRTLGNGSAAKPHFPDSLAGTGGPMKTDPSSSSFLPTWLVLQPPRWTMR